MSIALQTLKGQRIALVMLSTGLFGIALMIAATFETFGEVRGELFESLPEGFKVLLKAQDGLSSSATSYLATGYRHPVYLVALLAFTIAASSGAMAREIDRGTIFLLLSRSVARHTLVLAKSEAMAAGLVGLVAVGFLGSWSGVMIYGLGEADLGGLALVQVNAALLVMAVGGYSFLISALSNEGGRVVSVATGLTVTFFFLDYLAALWAPMSFVGPISVFHYYDPVTVAVSASLRVLDVAALAVVATAGFGASIVVFQRRDIPG